MNEVSGDSSRKLGQFLMSVRNRRRPTDVGLEGTYGKARRVAGLRREEVAQLASMSVNYYTRLEQGQGGRPSFQVLNSLADALRLSNDERSHLYDLNTRGYSPSDDHCAALEELVRPSLRGMIASYDAGPAVLIGRRTQVLAWNWLARTLFTGYVDLRDATGETRMPNLARLIFLDPNAVKLYPDWEDEARDLVGYIRMTLGRYPDDRELCDLIDELAAGSSAFTALWSGHVVWDKTFGLRQLHHPDVGFLELEFETLRLPDSPDQCIVLYRAPCNSPSAVALAQLERELVGMEAGQSARNRSTRVANAIGVSTIG